MARAALLLQLATTLPLVGLIWLVQVDLYPLFARATGPGFIAYHDAHTRWISFVVGPLMLGELLGALASVQVGLPETGWSAPWLGLALVGVAWLATVALSIPQHEVLARGFDPRAWQLLLDTNWIRTAAWTARGALLLWVVARTLGEH